MATKKEDNGLMHKIFGKAFHSKKFRVLLAGAIAMGLTALAAKYSFIDPAWSDKIAEYLLYGVGAFMGLQGLTDVASGGKTSSSHPDNK